MTITAEQIPNEAIETAARMAFTYYKSLPWEECTDKMLWCRLARISLLGGLNAWPGKWRERPLEHAWLCLPVPEPKP